MGISEEEKGLIFSSAMMQYIFNKTFQDHNDNKKFNFNAWSKRLDELTSDPMFNLSKEKQEQFQDACINLDQFIEDADAAPVPKLTLT